MNTRRKAREAVLQSLYQCDITEEWSSEKIQQYYNHFQQEVQSSTDSIVIENFSFAKSLSFGVLAKKNILDEKINIAAERKTITRMYIVERNIIRLATYEICFLDDIPDSVSINEAIEITKKYCSEDSSMFVNGVLDKVALNQRNS